MLSISRPKATSAINEKYNRFSRTCAYLQYFGANRKYLQYTKICANFPFSTHLNKLFIRSTFSLAPSHTS